MGQFLADNWLVLLLVGGMLFMHFGMHRGHGGHGGHGQERSGQGAGADGEPTSRPR